MKAAFRHPIVPDGGKARVLAVFGTLFYIFLRLLNHDGLKKTAGDMADQSLRKGFDESRLATASARVADVALQNDYTIIADTGHHDIAPYELIADPQTMAALANAGVKHIAVEKYVSENPVIEAYARGDISDRTMEYAMSIMGPPSLLDVYGGKNLAQEKAHFELVKNAKAHGIKVHAVDGMEGSYPSGPALEGALASIGTMKLTALEVIEADPKFFDMNRKQQGDFVTKALYDAGYNDTQVKGGLRYMGFLKETGVEKMTQDVAKKRLNDDPVVAERIAKYANGEKTVVIYGQGHFLRHYGDIDAKLAKSAVIDVHTNKEEYIPKAKREFGQLEKTMKVPFDDQADYELNLKTGVWKDNKTDESANVTTPQTTSLTPPLPERRHQEPIAPAVKEHAPTP